MNSVFPGDFSVLYFLYCPFSSFFVLFPRSKKDEKDEKDVEDEKGQGVFLSHSLSPFFFSFPKFIINIKIHLQDLHFNFFFLFFLQIKVQCLQNVPNRTGGIC